MKKYWKCYSSSEVDTKYYTANLYITYNAKAFY